MSKAAPMTFGPLPVEYVDGGGLRAWAAREPRMAVFAVMVRFRDARTGRAWPSVATIAELTGLGRRTVDRALARLRDMGVLEVVQQGGGRAESAPDGSKQYRATVYMVCPVKETAPTAGADTDGVTAPTTGADTVGVTAPGSSETAPTSARNRAPLGTKPRPVGHLTAPTAGAQIILEQPEEQKAEHHHHHHPARDGGDVDGLCDGRVGTQEEADREALRLALGEVGVLPGRMLEQALGQYAGRIHPDRVRELYTIGARTPGIGRPVGYLLSVLMPAELAAPGAVGAEQPAASVVRHRAQSPIDALADGDVSLVVALLQARGFRGYTEDAVRRMRDTGTGSESSRGVLADAIRAAGVASGPDQDTSDQTESDSRAMAGVKA